MKKDTKDILWDILQETNDKNVSVMLLNLIGYKESPDKLTYDDLFGRKLVSPVEQEYQKENALRDERIEWMTFCNFRSVPDSGESRRYGVSFSTDNKPVSVFLVGSNGAGKTTLYSALEHHYISASSLSKDMKLDEEKIMTYGFGAIEGQKPTALTVKTVRNMEEEGLESHEGLCSPASFCSEYDLKQLGEHGNDLTNYILEQLGYNELIPLMASLRAVITQKNNEIKDSSESHESDIKVEDYDSMISVLLQYGKRPKELLDKAKEYKSLFNMDYASYNAGHKMERFVGQWERLQGLSATAKIEAPIISLEKEVSIQKNSERANELTRKLTKMYMMTEDALKSCRSRSKNGLQVELEKMYRDRITQADKESKKILPEEEVNQIKTDLGIIDKVISELREKQKIIINDFCTKRFPMIKDILKIFSNQEELEIQENDVREEDGKKILRIVVKDAVLGMTAQMPTPQEFYNSFRYKLYAVSFKIALALMEMKRKNIRVPLVIDDVFNASDFENNIRLEYFVHNIYKAYDNMGMEVPLQLILLTHDEMVQTAFRKGANVLDDEEKGIVTQPREYISGRLFSYHHAKQMSKEIGDDTNSTFYNLYLEN